MPDNNTPSYAAGKEELCFILNQAIASVISTRRTIRRVLGQSTEIAFPELSCNKNMGLNEEPQNDTHDENIHLPTSLVLTRQ